MPNEPVADLRIRAAHASDAAALARLIGELGYETTDAEMMTRLQSILSDGRYKTVVAVIGGQICGMIGTISFPSYEHNDLSGRIIALVVSKQMRRTGIGARLIAAAERDFEQRKITRIAVNTRLTRQDAHQFYEKLGYKRTGFRFSKNLSLTINDQVPRKAPLRQRERRAGRPPGARRNSRGWN